MSGHHRPIAMRYLAVSLCRPVVQIVLDFVVVPFPIARVFPTHLYPLCEQALAAAGFCSSTGCVCRWSIPCVAFCCPFLAVVCLLVVVLPWSSSLLTPPVSGGPQWWWWVLVVVAMVVGGVQLTGNLTSHFKWEGSVAGVVGSLWVRNRS